MQEKEQEDEQDKVKDKDQEYGYDQEYELTSAVCLSILRGICSLIVSYWLKYFMLTYSHL